MAWRRPREIAQWQVTCSSKTSPLVVPFLTIGARCPRCNGFNREHPHGRRQLVIVRLVAA